jgi:hypothetical protein
VIIANKGMLSMLQEIKGIAPVSVVIGILAWVLFVHFFLAKEINTRIAYADYIPMCEQRLVNRANTTALEILGEHASEEARKSVGLSAIQNMNEQMKNPFGGGRDYEAFVSAYGTHPLDVLTGGMMSKAQRTLEEGLERQRQAAIEKANTAKKNILAKTDAQCSCEARLAYVETKDDWTAYVATFGLFEPDSVSNFASNMSMQTKTCFERLS